MQEENKLNERFNDYLEGNSAPLEQDFMGRWLRSLDLRKDKKARSFPFQRQRSEEELRALLHPITPGFGQMRQLIVRAGLAAAGILLFLTASLLLYRAVNPRQPTSSIQFAVVSTQAGEMKTITLPDGTRITLNNQTRIKYPKEFNGKSREVFLNGEAFFEVKHDKIKPFKVHTDKLLVQVLGTSFNIQAYVGEPALTIAVATGKVGVFANDSKSDKTYMLLPGEQLSYNRASEGFKQSLVTTGSIAAWQQGILIFRNEKMESIARRLEKFYKVKILFKNKGLMNREISFRSNNLSLELVMKALSAAGEFNYKIQYKQVLIW